MAEAPVPAAPAAPAEAPPPDIFQSYLPEGAMGGLFAPGYIRGYAPSETAVANWTAANRSVTPQVLEQTRMPAAWVNPDEQQALATGMYGGKGMSATGFDRYGSGRIPNSLSFGLNQGPVDPEALRTMAQGGKYDIGARRDAIAQRLMANQTQQKAYEAQKAAEAEAYNPWAYPAKFRYR